MWPSKATTGGGPTLRRLHSPRQGARRRDAAGLCDERGTAAAQARLPGPCRRTGLRGVRSPKWLRRITVQDHPSDNPMQADDYKLFPPDVTAETADPAKGHTIETMPLNAAICEPRAGARLETGETPVRGYAIAGDRRVVRVDVSGDGGRSWRQATLEHTEAGALRLDVLENRAGPSTRRTRTRGARLGLGRADPSRRCRTTRGTSRATSAPRGTVWRVEVA